MMPRLDARERIARSQDMALGNGTLEDDVRRELLEELNTRARGPQRAKAATRRDIAGAGIGIRVSPAKAEPDNV
jgi:hypothetical protein